MRSNEPSEANASKYLEPDLVIREAEEELEEDEKETLLECQFELICGFSAENAIQ
jgi:hypothetical protein